MIDRRDLDRLQQPAELAGMTNSLGSRGDVATRQWAVARAADHLSAWFDASPADVVAGCPTYPLLVREARHVAMRALAIRARLHAYAERSCTAEQARYLYRAVDWRAPREEIHDALQEARARLLEQIHARPFACDERYACYEQFRTAVRTTAFRILAGGQRGVLPILPVLITDPAATGLPRGVRDRLADRLGGTQRLRWVVATCEGLTPEEIARSETALLREPVEAFAVYQAVDVVRRWYGLDGQVPRPPRHQRERYVREWIRWHSHDRPVAADDLELIVRALVGDSCPDEATAARLARLSWDLRWFRYWIDPARAELDRRLEECRRAVRHHCPELAKESHVDTVAAHLAGEPQAQTACRQYHARMRRSARAGAVKTELCMLRRHYPSVGVIAPA